MSSFDRILELVNEKNIPTYTLNDTNVQLSNLVVDNPDNTHNTRVTMKSVPGGGYVGEVELFYTRANLSSLGALEFVQEPPFTYDQLLGLIARTKNANMGSDDFTNGTLPAMDTGVVTAFVLSAKSGSLGWLGNTQVKLLTGIPDEAPALYDFLMNNVATLFKPQPI